MRELFAHVKKQDPEIYGAIYKEIARQHDNLELIASENYASLAVMEAQGCVMTNKYAEGYPSARWYGGCDHVDTAETRAIERAQRYSARTTSMCSRIRARRRTPPCISPYFRRAIRLWRWILPAEATLRTATA